MWPQAGNAVTVADVTQLKRDVLCRVSGGHTFFDAATIQKSVRPGLQRLDPARCSGASAECSKLQLTKITAWIFAGGLLRELRHSSCVAVCAQAVLMATQLENDKAPWHGAGPALVTGATTVCELAAALVAPLSSKEQQALEHSVRPRSAGNESARSAWIPCAMLALQSQDDGAVMVTRQGAHRSLTVCGQTCDLCGAPCHALIGMHVCLRH